MQPNPSSPTKARMLRHSGFCFPAILRFFENIFAKLLDIFQIRAIIWEFVGTPTEYGGVPEWPKGTDCKSAAFRFDGSNPSSPTKAQHFGVGLFVMHGN